MDYSEQTAERQYTRALLFSSVVGLMSLVVRGIHPSVSAAYKALEKLIGVSRPALYGKLNGLEPAISQALVRYSDVELRPLVETLGRNPRPRHGDLEVTIFTNLPVEVADALTVAELYHARWRTSRAPSGA